MLFELVSQGKTVNRQAGFSLFELLIVLTILGIIAAALAPGISTTNTKKIELAASEVAQAIRFARSEAIRTGKGHGIHASTSTQQLRVYVLKDILSIKVPDYSVRHPIDKKLFHLSFDQDRSLMGMQLSSVTFTFVGFAIAVDYLGFDGTGLPKYNNAGTIHMLETATVVISDGDLQKTVSVAPITGRVTVY